MTYMFIDTKYRGYYELNTINLENSFMTEKIHVPKYFYINLVSNETCRQIWSQSRKYTYRGKLRIEIRQ